MKSVKQQVKQVAQTQKQTEGLHIDEEELHCTNSPWTNGCKIHIYIYVYL